MDIGLGKNGVVLKLGSSDGWAIVGDKDKFGLSGSEGFDSVFVA
tara:strand:- start:314 stop:445 length:132 start_codon:yes stop_codon:yes gene_type:complete